MEGSNDFETEEEQFRDIANFMIWIGKDSPHVPNSISAFLFLGRLFYVVAAQKSLYDIGESSRIQKIIMQTV